MNKKILIGILVLSMIVCSSGVFGASTSATGRTQLYFHDVDVTMVNHDPDPAEAGRYVTVRFKVENTGAETAKDIVLEILPKYPFSLDPGESAIKSIGSVRSRQIGDTGVIEDYRLRIDENAIEGDNEIELRYNIDGGSWIKLEPFDIEVNPHDIILSIASVESPSMINPGEVSRIDINLENLALSFLKEVKVKLNIDDIPFATIGSTNRKIIKQIEADSTAMVSFNIMAEPDAESQLYKVPIELEYNDRLGVKYNKTEIVGLIVGAEPDLSVIIDDSEIYNSGGTGEVSIKLTNKGVTDIKFVNLMLLDGEYTILSPEEVYVGNIDSDDYETADFNLKLDKLKTEEVALPLILEYKDANNNEYKEEIRLPLKLYSSSDAKAIGVKKGNSTVGIVIVLIIVVGGFFIYRRWRKKKKGQKMDGFGTKVPFLGKK